jgi:hypothetical protein
MRKYRHCRGRGKDSGYAAVLILASVVPTVDEGNR